jgi:hypothetical protein
MLQVCFIWMLQVYYLDIAYVFAIVFKCFPGDFLQVFLKLVSSVSSAFRYTMQVLHLDFLKVNRVLHLPRCFSAASLWCLLFLRGDGWALLTVVIVHFKPSTKHE